MSRPITTGWSKLDAAGRRAYERERYARKYAKTLPGKDIGEQRRCSKCLTYKPRTIEFFYATSNVKSGFQRMCIACVLHQSRERHTKNKFNIERSEYETLLANASCQICGSTHKRVLDHHHNKNHLRGVLCSNCNSGLGMFKDDPARLQRAIQYLENDNADSGSNLNCFT